MYVNYYPNISTGLSYVYREHDNGKRDQLWKPVEIDGYPAVYYRFKPDRTGCDIDTGVSDSSFYNVHLFFYAWRGYDGQDTCAMVNDIAQAVLSTIKTGN